MKVGTQSGYCRNIDIKISKHLIICVVYITPYDIVVYLMAKRLIMFRK